MGLIDEYQLAIHPIILGSGLTLFKDIHERVNLKLLKNKKFGSGVVVLYYERK
jgi:dihydrofolate reductase